MTMICLRPLRCTAARRLSPSHLRRAIATGARQHAAVESDVKVDLNTAEPSLSGIAAPAATASRAPPTLVPAGIERRGGNGYRVLHPQQSKELFGRDRRGVAFTFSRDGEDATSFLEAAVLRDNCGCAQCRDPHSHQRNFALADLPANIDVREAKQSSDGSVELLWSNDAPGYADSHATRISTRTLGRLLHGDVNLMHLGSRSANRPWQRDEMQNIYGQGKNRASYDDFIGDDATRVRILQHLHTHGLAFFDGVPSDEKAVEKLGETIGPLRHTFYGRTWDVKDKPKATNVAYTSGFLGMHMDLLYMKEPPGVQLLHCIESSCEGGESLFIDAFDIARTMWRFDRATFETLARFPVSYHYMAPGTGKFYFDTKPTFEVDPISPWVSDKAEIAETPPPLANVNWSPPFQAPLTVDVGLHDDARELQRYLEAAKSFARVANDSNEQFKLKLEPGQCVVFNNRRVLHGREAFRSGTGARWLKGAYVDTDDLQSGLRHLSHHELTGFTSRSP